MDLRIDFCSCPHFLDTDKIQISYFDDSMDPDGIQIVCKDQSVVAVISINCIINCHLKGTMLTTW